MFLAQKYLFFGVFAAVNMGGQPQYEPRIEPPIAVTPGKALYQLLKTHLLETWSKLTQMKEAIELTDPIPIYELSHECNGQKLIVIPFEGLRFYSRGQIHRADELWRNKEGTPLLIYAVDFKAQRFKLLFYRRLVDFYGSLADSPCPHLVVATVNFKTQEVGSSELIYFENPPRYEIRIMTPQRAVR